MIENTIIKNIEIAKNVYQMEVFAPKIAKTSKAGQFVNMYLKDKSKLLPRPISICGIEGETLVLVYGVVGKGTEELSTYKAGEETVILGPFGNGFDLESLSVKTAVLVGGGIGVPPMLQLAKELKGKAEKCIAVIGFREEPFLVEQLEVLCDEVYVATDNGSTGFHGNVVALIQKESIQGDFYFACGPKVMLKNLSAYCGTQITKAHAQGIPIQVSLEERMGCGYGACVGCTCKTKGGQKKVCTDGPVFLGNEVVWND